MAWDPALEAASVLLGRLKRTTDSAPLAGPARRKNVDSTAGPAGLVAWGEPRSNSTNYYYGIVKRSDRWQLESK